MNWIRTRWGVGTLAALMAGIVAVTLTAGVFAGTRPAASAATAAPGRVSAAANSGITVPAGSSGTVTSTTLAGNQPSVTVSATGTANGTPDTVTIDIGASTTAATASDALSQNNTEMTHLEAILTAAGATPSDLETSGLDLNPSYDPSGTVTGYEADDTLTVTLHDVSTAGAVIDAAAGAVGNDVRLNGVSFSVSDTSALSKQARTEAMQMAATEAGNLAAGAGETIGQVLSITDNEQSSPPPVQYFARAAGAVSTAPSTPVPLQAGSESVSVNVQVVYALIAPTS